MNYQLLLILSISIASAKPPETNKPPHLAPYLALLHQQGIPLQDLFAYVPTEAPDDHNRQSTPPEDYWDLYDHVSEN